MATRIVGFSLALATLVPQARASFLACSNGGTCSAGALTSEHLFIQRNTMRRSPERTHPALIAADSPTCEDQWNNRACSGQFGHESCHTCGERIDYLKSSRGGRKTDAEAKASVAREFLSQCGACGPDDDSNRITTEGYTEVFRDDFEGQGGVDTNKWEHVNRGGGFGNRERQFYTDREENSFMSNGTLKIKALREHYGGESYTSAKLQSRADFLYGKVSIRARLPQGQATGTWAALWMMPRKSEYGGWPKSGEIDIMEHVGYDSGKLHGTVHAGCCYHSIGTQVGGSTRADVGEWHTYQMEWSPELVKFAMDGSVYQVYAKKSDDPMQWPFNKPFYVIMNMAVGGDWGGLKGIDKDAFRGDGQVMEVDWVSVEQKDWPVPVPACCGGCTEGKNFCSPRSGTCYATKTKNYYAECVASEPAGSAAPSLINTPVSSPANSSCSDKKISRRRRAGKMCSCRRRSGPSCQGDKVTLEQADSGAIKVMSYNLMGWNAFNLKKRRGEKIMQKVKTWYPAVLGCQEVEKGGGRGYDDVRAAMESGTGLTHAGGAQFYDPTIVEPHEMEQTSLVGGYWMSMTRFKHIGTGSYFLFFNSHWKHGYGIEQATKVSSFIQAKREQFGPLPVILVGDTNQFCNGYERSAWKYLQGEKGDSPIVFEDVLAHDRGRSFSDNNNPNCRVDLIMVSQGDWSVRQSDIDRDGMGVNGDASDHAPLMAELVPLTLNEASM